MHRALLPMLSLVALACAPADPVGLADPRDAGPAPEQGAGDLDVRTRDAAPDTSPADASPADTLPLDAQPPEPDAAAEPDVPPELDAAPEPDAAPELDAAPEPDAAPPEPDAAPVPDAAPPMCPLDIPVVAVGQAGGRFELPIAQGPGAVQSGCAEGRGAEVLLEITLTEPSRISLVILNADGVDVGAAAHLRSDCLAPETEMWCRGTHMRGPAAVPYLEPGVWFIFVEQGLAPPDRPSTVDVRVRVRHTQCNDEIDNDGDGLVDLLDDGCYSPNEDFENNPDPPPECNDGIDNDMDGHVDFPDEPDCDSIGDTREGRWCDHGTGDEVCVLAISAPCQQGSAWAWCTARDGRVITFAELETIIAAGWHPPHFDEAAGWRPPHYDENDSYDTVSVTEYDRCPDGDGTVGLPGWDSLSHQQCGDEQDVCNRSIICVR